MKPHKLRFRLGMGLLTWFLSTRLLTLFPKEHIPQVTLEHDGFSEIICGVREYGRIWGCFKFVFQWVGLRSITFLWKVFGCHTRFSEENRMHLICVLGSEFHTYDRLMSVISQNNTQNKHKRFINFYYTHQGRLEGLYTNNNNYEDVTPSSSSTGF
jgi:hypothetical protein